MNNLILYYDSESHGKRRYLASLAPKSKDELWSYEKKDAVLLGKKDVLAAVMFLTTVGYTGMVAKQLTDKRIKQLKQVNAGFQVLDGGGSGDGVSKGGLQVVSDDEGQTEKATD